MQFDEPAFNVYMDEVNDWGIKALERAAHALGHYVSPDDAALARLALALLLGTPGLAALTLGVSAITAGLQRGGALTGLLVLPLAVLWASVALHPVRPG